VLTYEQARNLGELRAETPIELEELRPQSIVL